MGAKRRTPERKAKFHMSQDDAADTDTDLDAAILAADKQREQYVLERLSTRRRMAVVAFGQFVFGGAGVVLGGLLLNGWAERIDHMGTFLSLYFGALAGIIMAYWGIGAYERNTMGGMGSQFGSYSGGGYGQPMAAARPRIVKSQSVTTNTTVSAETETPHRSPDGL
jgi:hypothetical protein